MKFTSTIRCDIHGLSEWQGDLFCESCHRRFQCRDSLGADFAPTMCHCGVRLCPERPDAPHASYSGAAICHTCAITPEAEA